METTENKAVRIDKFLYAVRLFKTRSLASQECLKGRISVNGVQVKPSRMITAGEILNIKRPPVILSFRVIATLENRIGARLVSNYIEDLTPEEEKMKLELRPSFASGFREKGSGRPTKKERRSIDRLREDLF